MDRCIRCVTRIEPTGKCFCGDCENVVEKFMLVGTDGICWKCAEFLAKPDAYFCGDCGVEVRQTAPFADHPNAGKVYEPDANDDVLVAVAAGVPEGTVCRSDTNVYDMSQHVPTPPTTTKLPPSPLPPLPGLGKLTRLFRLPRRA